METLVAEPAGGEEEPGDAGGVFETVVLPHPASRTSAMTIQANKSNKRLWAEMQYFIEYKTKN